jgi:hypothetical protein
VDGSEFSLAGRARLDFTPGEVARFPAMTTSVVSRLAVFEELLGSDT